ncbi:MAG TPA: MarR family transcriptional regulator [Gemmatimonadales bacterium]|nr:MarR family transcriptional regulator [Gemmatimonadales bacterium]
MPKPSRYRGDRVERLALSTYLKLTRASETLWNRLAPGLQGYELTPSQFGVLEALHHLGPMHQCELGERILKSSGNMTLVIDNLEKRGLVRRERSLEDRRFIQVHLTEDGERLIRRVFPMHADAITRQLAVLTQEEQRALGNLCRKLGAVA